jgi:uncharacterized protein YqhQ
MAERFNYGGQAVIEGVMIRGRKFVSVAVRRPNGGIRTQCEPLSQLYTGRWRKLPFIRGIIILVETLVLGLKSLMFSANVALEDPDKDEAQDLGSFATGGMLAISLAVAVGIFFIGPLLITRALDDAIESSIVSNLVEGGIRLAIFLLYVWAMGLLPDMRRVFAYHGAEHMTIAAHEHGRPLTVGDVRPFPKEHPRCGTAFLLVVMVVAILTFAFMGRPDLWLRILSRVLLIPAIAAVSYEVIRFNAAHEGHPLAKLAIAPGLGLQRLTTRKPEDKQIEVAISAMQEALRADGEGASAAAAAPSSARPGEAPATGA